MCSTIKSPSFYSDLLKEIASQAGPLVNYNEIVVLSLTPLDS
jgi:hypothetical protein